MVKSSCRYCNNRHIDLHIDNRSKKHGTFNGKNNANESEAPLVVVCAVSKCISDVDVQH